jgi:YbbR domain-containing protein
METADRSIDRSILVWIVVCLLACLLFVAVVAVVFLKNGVNAQTARALFSSSHS